jgi:Galactose oxidase, central domain
MAHRHRKRVAGLGLAAVLAVGLAGCAGSTASPSVSLSQVPSVDQTATPSPTATATATRTATPTATVTPTPSPTPTPTPIPRFVATGSMHVPRWGASATLLANGKVLVAGGYADIDENVLASAELYDPSTGKFTMTGSMGTARGGPDATLLRDGRVLIAGGAGCSDIKTCAKQGVTQLSSAEIYDPKTGKFSRTGSMSVRRGGIATLLRDGRVLLAADSLDSLSAELYNPDTGKFVDTGSVMGYYNSATATLLPNGKVLIAGDLGVPGAELYDPATGKFTPISFALPPGVAATAKRDGYSPAPQTATLLKDGRVLLYGLQYLETYSPSTGAFTPCSFAWPPGAWYDPTATLLNDGDVLFAGGSVVPENPDQWIPAVASAGLYDPVSGFQFITSMHAARDTATATLLPDGSVLIAGGRDINGDALSSAELFK